ncbi:hypothetical protein L915_20235 [Phytophthora nicotianae]|uniref:Uncharacterized protein n=1 Tax=Phytophthora nicotianae TaxID=4792 RepID=W2FRM6_PHYNI|nr:hypothetical protein L915_20235 [Phytophthora nicotianae]
MDRGKMIEPRSISTFAILGRFLKLPQLASQGWDLPYQAERQSTAVCFDKNLPRLMV